MFFGKLLKCIALFLIGVVIMSTILYFTGVVCLIIGIFNEYIFGCFLGAVYSAIILLLRNKTTTKLKISNKLYLIFTTLIPSLGFSICYLFLHNFYVESSILDVGISEIIYYLIFTGFAFLLATIIVTIIELLRSLIQKIIQI